MSTEHREQLRHIRTFPQLVKYLRDELDWPIESHSFDDLTFDYEPEELGIDAKTAAKIDGIKQLRPLVTNQSWGIFFVKFEPKRLPVVALRRILGQCVFKKRASANRDERRAWNVHDLLFVSAYGEDDDRQISLAHFSEDPLMGNLATLKVLGWDGEDTGLYLDHVHQQLHAKLRWPDDPADADKWRDTWSSAFTLRHREVITTSRDLALALADLAGKIRKKVNAALAVETEHGKLSKLMKAFQESLIHDLDADDFADMYAQTIAYGLFSASISRASGALVADDVALMASKTSPFLRELLETFLNLGGRKRKANGDALDFDELGINDVVEMLRAAKMEAVLRDFDNRNPQEDPVIHFYELFLKEYDAKKRLQRGVFYTPKPVVSYIVRSVHELLQTEFGLVDGLADTTTWGEMAVGTVDAASSRVGIAEYGTQQDAASTLVQYFAPEEPVANLSGNLPHWRQEGVTYFVTFRLADSLPQEKLRQWLAERDAWLKANPEPHTPDQRREYNRLFPARFQHWLDQGYGSCVLGQPDVNTLVENALRHFDGKRYSLDKFVVMPNHVHVLVTPLPGHELSEILHSWKSYTASEINRRRGASGSLWQKESFDHIVRSPESMEGFRRYIRDNPASVDAASSRVAIAEYGTRQDAASTFSIPEGVFPDQPFVQILDPAAGTATFLVEVIDIVHRTMTAKWRAAGRTDAQIGDLWNDYVPKHLLPRLHGYELLMAPYAIAHMKIGLKLAETGYRFQSEERVRVYLTNALEPPPAQDRQLTFADWCPALAHEAAAVNAVKRHQRFTVVIGNPPYSGISANMSDAIIDLVEPYKSINGVSLGERKIWAQDDYKKFIRFSQLRISHAGCGILGFITNHGFINEPTGRGMRHNLLGTFFRASVLDLHGSLKKREVCPDGSPDKNVFDIEPGVAISFFRRGGVSPDSVTHSDLWGLREVKYDYLQRNTLQSTKSVVASPSAEFYLFVPQGEDAKIEFSQLVSITEVFESGSNGIQTSRDHVVYEFSRSECRAIIEEFREPEKAVPTSELRDKYWPGKKVASYAAGDTRGWRVPDARDELRRDKDWESKFKRALYRPFDFQTLFYSDYMIDWPRSEVMSQMLRPNLSLCVGRAGSAADNQEWNIIFVADTLVDMNLFYRGGNVNYPLRFAPISGSFDFDRKARPNFKAAFLKAVSGKIGIPQTDDFGLPRGLTPEDIFHYAYAVFHSPGYRSRYAEFLKIDFPRLPLTGNLKLFRALARLGGELVALHLMESPKLDKPLTTYTGPVNPEVGKVGFHVEAASSRLHTRQDAASTLGTVWLDAAATRKGQPATPGTIGFRGVPEPVWNFHIGGYQVCQKWLKDRKGRTLTADDIAHYHRIVVALHETIRIMGDIDRVIDAHGGWPGAFATEPLGEALSRTARSSRSPR